MLPQARRALDAIRTVQQDATATPEDRAAAARCLRDAIADLADVLGSHRVPGVLHAVLECHRDYGAAFMPPAILPAVLAHHPDAAAVTMAHSMWETVAVLLDTQARADLDTLAAAAVAPPVRPAMPTAAYCLLKGCRVRWRGERPLQPVLYHILEFLLSRTDYPVPVTDLEEEVWPAKPITDKTIANHLSRLSTALEPIKFPWTWGISKAHIVRQP
jgi:hypothetical protein